MKKYFKKIEIKDIAIFLIPFLIFLGYLYIYNPGILSYDSYNQITQIHTNIYNNWHPFFHTFIERTCFKIYDSPISVGIFQIFIFSLMWTIICHYFRKNDEHKNFILQILFTIVITLIIPINAIYSITLWKDILFSYFLMFLTFLMYVIIDKKYEINNIILLSLSITMAFIWNLRPNGSYVIIPFLIILSIILFIKNRSNYMFIKIPVLTIIITTGIISLNYIYKVEDNSKDALATKVAHGLAYYVENVDINSRDMKVISKFINVDNLDDKFYITFSDPVIDIINYDEFQKNRITYIKIFIKYSLKNPSNMLKYIFKSSAINWYIVRGDDWIGGTYYTDINSVNNVENYQAINLGRKRYNILNKYVNDFNNNKITNSLFYSPALCMYLSIAILLFLTIKYIKNIFLIYLPNLFNVIIVALSIPVQDTRYLYSNILVFYLLFIIFISFISIKNKKKE